MMNQLILKDNEVPLQLFIRWMNAYFGSCRTGSPFKVYLIEAYCRQGYLPLNYGAFPVYLRQYYEFDGVRTVTIEGITRDEIIQWMRQHPFGIVKIQDIMIRKYKYENNKRTAAYRRSRVIEFQKRRKEEREKDRELALLKKQQNIQNEEYW